MQYVLRRHHNKKYRCRCVCVVETAEPPTKLIPGRAYSVGFAVPGAAEEYDGYLAQKRQVRGMTRLGFNVTSQILWGTCSPDRS